MVFGIPARNTFSRSVTERERNNFCQKRIHSGRRNAQKCGRFGIRTSREKITKLGQKSYKNIFFLLYKIVLSSPCHLCFFSLNSCQNAGQNTESKREGWETRPTVNYYARAECQLSKRGLYNKYWKLGKAIANLFYVEGSTFLNK